MPNPDVCRKFHGGDECSEAANDSIQDQKEGLRELVRLWISACGYEGSTCDEAEVGLGLRHQTASARMRELVQTGQVIKTRMKRETRSGRKAFVLLALEYVR
jgi:hypothetical protein